MPHPARPATTLDLFRDLPLTGNFVLVSAIDGATVAGGVITWAQAGAPAVGDNVFVLEPRAARPAVSAPILAILPADRQSSAAARRNSRLLLRSAGVAVLIEI